MAFQKYVQSSPEEGSKRKQRQKIEQVKNKMEALVLKIITLNVNGLNKSFKESLIE